MLCIETEIFRDHEKQSQIMAIYAIANAWSISTKAQVGRLHKSTSFTIVASHVHQLAHLYLYLALFTCTTLTQPYCFVPYNCPNSISFFFPPSCREYLPHTLKFNYVFSHIFKSTCIYDEEILLFTIYKGTQNI